MAGRFPYYLLADSYEGKKKERELNPIPGQSEAVEGAGVGDIKRGFVYKRVPHVTLKSIANNEEIDGHSREIPCAGWKNCAQRSTQAAGQELGRMGDSAAEAVRSLGDF
jgi:hypothetical protein